MIIREVAGKRAAWLPGAIEQGRGNKRRSGVLWQKKQCE